MKQINLKSLTLTNWRGEKQRTTSFNANETTISGGNGLGKSRHFDAFMWLLFGKDSQDRKDFNIKTIVDGKPLENVECEVSGIFDVDGEEIRLRRSFVEDWVKPRGQVEQVFKGNHTETYWNDVPVNVGEYQKRVNEIINDSVFKMITNPLFFANMKWQNQREQLFQLAGNITNEEIAAKNPEFSALLDAISGKSLADFKKELSARKKRLKDDLAQIQPRIDQTAKMMPEDADFVAIEAEIAAIDAQINEVDKQMLDEAEAIRKQRGAVIEKQIEIEDMKSEASKIIYSAKSRHQMIVNEANSARREAESNIAALQSEIESLQRVKKMNDDEIERLTSKISSIKKEIDALRDEWFKVNENEYKDENGVITCPLMNVVCNNAEIQSRIDDNKKEARAKFDADKSAKLAEINQNGNNARANVEWLEKGIVDAKNAAEKTQKEIEAKNGELVKQKESLSGMGEAKTEEFKSENITEYVELEKRIKAAESAMAEMEKAEQPSSVVALSEQKRILSCQRDEANKKLASREAIDKCNAEIDNLNKQGKEIAQQIADCEREEYKVQQFNKAKIDECEQRINGLFTMVKFRLFDYNIDDAKKENPIETCIPLVNGIPFQVANTAGQVNAGLDIINALCKYYDICAPIFIDNRESVNEIIPTESQIITLEVTAETELNVN